jgi:hypothetical protein
MRPNWLTTASKLASAKGDLPPRPAATDRGRLASRHREHALVDVEPDHRAAGTTRSATARASTPVPQAVEHALAGPDARRVRHARRPLEQRGLQSP